MKRCDWLNLNNELYVKYHDDEWSVPVHDDNKLFEFLILEGAQAGLSWETVLKKRENYRKAFSGFNPKLISKFDDSDFDRLMNDEGIIRNRLKIKSAINNAQLFLKIQEEFGSFDNYIWKFVGNKQIVNTFKTVEEIPAKTEISDNISKDLKKRGFNFVGSTIMYAFMQAVGMVNDHTTDCFCYNC